MVPGINSFNITQRLQDRKEDLEREYSGLHTRAEAERLLEKMRLLLDTDQLDGMSDPHNRLFSILESSSQEYKADHHNEKGKADPLLRVYLDKKEVQEAIEEYAKYVKNLPSKEEVEQRFLNKLSKVYAEYKTSADYMTRLVSRLLHEDLRTTPDGKLREEPTSVLILRQFIHEFGYFDKTTYGSSDSKTYKCRTLEYYIKNMFGGDCERMAKEADTQLLLSLMEKESPVHDWAALCAIIETKGAGIPAKNWKDKNLLRSIFIPDILKDEEGFTQADTVLDCFRVLPSSRLNDCVCPEVVNIDAIRNLLNASFTQHALKDHKLFPAHVRLSALCQFYADIEICPDNPLLTELPDFCIKKHTPPLSGDERLNNIFVVDEVKKLTADKVTEQAAAGLGTLEAQIKKTDEYILKLYLVLANKCNNRIDTLRASIVDLHYSEKARIAKDLAEGYFGNQHKTREYLYLFAIAFAMINGDVSTATPSPERDIRKNLFEDYYTDNLLNHLEKPRSQGEEKMVDGYGINYKNFVEVIFLYCINLRQKGLTSLQILQKACKMIKYCSKCGSQAKSIADAAQAAETSNKTNDAGNPDFTSYYKSRFLTTLLHETEGVFCETVCKEYECNSNTADVAIRSENRTAYNICMQLFDYINGLRVGSYQFGLNRDADHGYIADVIGAQRILSPMTHCRYNHCTSCETFRNRKAEMFVPATSCRHFGKDDCSLNGLSRKDPQICYDCMHYKEVKMDDFVPYYDCREYASCEHIPTAATAGKLNVAECQKMLTNIAARERKRLADSCCNADRFAWFAESEDLDENFRKLLMEITLRLNAFWEAGPLFDISKASRSTLISLYYLYLVIYNQTKENKTTCSFAEYYVSFCNEIILPVYFNDDRKADPNLPANINNCLQLAGYQPINPKNIYDIFVCFLAYKDSYDTVFDFSELWNELSKTF